MDVVSETPSTKSVYLGTLEKERPEFGVIVDEENEAGLWCSNIYTDRMMRRSQICDQWKTTEWHMFEDHHLFPDLKKCTNIYQHFDVVVIDLDDEKAKLFSEKRFGFYVNDNNQRNKKDGVWLRIYSEQEKQIVLSWVSYNEKGTVYRYGNEDRAFCLSENSQKVNRDLPSAKSVCEGASNNDVCSYIVMVTPVTENEKEKEKIYCDGVDGLLNPMFGTASATSSLKDKYRYTNVMQGGKTNTNFEETKPKYEGAPITFYHLTLVTYDDKEPKYSGMAKRVSKGAT